MTIWESFRHVSVYVRLPRFYLFESKNYSPIISMIEDAIHDHSGVELPNSNETIRKSADL